MNSDIVYGVYSPGGVLLSPFWARAAHVVQLGPIRVEQRAPQPAPPPSDYIKTAAFRRGRKQHSRHVRVCKRGHYKPPFSVPLSHGGPHIGAWRGDPAPSSGTETPLQAQSAAAPSARTLAVFLVRITRRMTCLHESMPEVSVNRSGGGLM